MTLVTKQAIFSKNVAKLINHVFESGYSCSLGETFRTKEQAAIYAKAGTGILDSQHCKKLAIDIHLFDLNGNYLTDPKYYKPLAVYWQTLDPSNRSGINFPRGDSNHFEMKD
jgi:hypothetical protein